ncbi:MAG TPA: nucleotidyl transferase AbiEii/AbiGii toxin family protein [Syntrophomonadaceae bacterium]|nr:nucleotidyl transferase AbiEii/AbiGii toxin family protein [Syntrophomonadaceae bacterium]
MWVELLKKAFFVLKASEIKDSEWTFGGGTALALIFRHRESRDVDIFFSDAQMLTLITPRLNRKVERLTDDYVEGSSFLKLRFGEGEIDFIVTPHLIPGDYFKVMHVAGKDIQVEIPEEIVLKKLFYRSEALKVRDIVDTAVVYDNCRESLMKHVPLIAPKLGLLRYRQKRLREIYYDEAGNLVGLDPAIGKRALSIFEAFLNEAEQVCCIRSGD